MSAVAGYARRVAALPSALAILELHPEGLPLTRLAAELGVDAQDLRETFLAYYRADVVDLGDFRLPVLEFVGTDGADDEDPATAEIVRVAASDPERELGVEYLTADQLAALHTAAADLAALEPGNAVLAEALEAFEAGLWPAESARDASWETRTAGMLNDSARQRRRVRVQYARAWLPGTAEREIEPWRVIRTRRGWEVDARIPAAAGGADEVRTFLVSGIRAAEVLDDVFELPSDADDRMAANRAPTDVELVVPQSGRWAVDRFAESVRVLADDEESVHVRAALLPPVAQRLGLVLLSAGPDAFVMEPARLRSAGADVAARLLAHHEADGT